MRPFRDDVKALTGGRGVDVVYDGVGGDISLESLRCVRFGARFLIVGWAATPFVARGKGQRGAPERQRAADQPDHDEGPRRARLPDRDLDRRRSRRSARRGSRRSSRGPRAGKLTPHVSHTFPLAEFKDAMRAKWNGEVIGGCVLHPS